MPNSSQATSAGGGPAPGVKTKTGKQTTAGAELERFRKDLGPFVAAAEMTRMPMVFTDAKEAGNPIIFANDAFLALTCYNREEVLAQSFNSLMARGVDPDALAEVKAAFEGATDNQPVVHYRRKDSSEFWASLFVSPVRSESGEILQHFVSFVDLTKHKEDESRARMLIDELNHRVKNTLQVVQVIVSEAFRNASDPAVVRESIEARLFALSRSHDLLMSENWDGAGLADLVKAALEPFRDVNGRADRFVISGTNIHLPPRATLALGIAFHELAMNAAKYGALSTTTGSIVIAWTIKHAPDGKRLVLHWQEKGGPPVSRPTRIGFGSRVIERGLAQEMEGTVHLEFPAAGVTCTIDIPAPQGACDE